MQNPEMQKTVRQPCSTSSHPQTLMSILPLVLAPRAKMKCLHILKEQGEKKQTRSEYFFSFTTLYVFSAVSEPIKRTYGITQATTTPPDFSAPDTGLSPSPPTLSLETQRLPTDPPSPDLPKSAEQQLFPCQGSGGRRSSLLPLFSTIQLFHNLSESDLCPSVC